MKLLIKTPETLLTFTVRLALHVFFSLLNKITYIKSPENVIREPEVLW